MNESRTTTRGSGALWLAGALFVASVLVHVAVWLGYRSDPFALTYISDAFSYDRLATGIAEQGIAGQEVFHQSPLFPILLGWLYRAVAPADRAWWAILMQIAFTSTAIALLVPAGRFFFRSTTAGVAAGVVALLHGPLVFHSMKLVPIPLAVATQAAALVALGWTRERGGLLRGMLCGAACGLAIVARSEMLLFLPVVLAALGYGEAASRRKGSARVAIPMACLVGAALIVVPITAHNRKQGDGVLVASAAGENLFSGNQRGATGRHKPIHPQAGDLLSQRRAAKQLAEEALGRELRPSEVSDYWRGRAFDEIRAAPGEWLGLELRKLGLILHPGDPADMYSFTLERGRYLPVLYLLGLPAWGVGLLGLLGCRRAIKEMGGRVWPLVGFVLVQLIVLMTFFVSTRLRLPLLFALCPFAGFAAVAAFDDWKQRSRKMAPAITAAVLLVIVVAEPLTSVPSNREVLRLASVLSKQDRLDESLEVLAPVLARNEPYGLGLDQAGWVLSKQGDLSAARDHYLEAIAAGLPASREAQTRTRLGMVYERLGQLSAAGESHDLAVASGHANAGTYYERGMFRMRQGDRSGAVDDLTEAARLAPGWPEPRRALQSLAPGLIGPAER